MNDTELIPGLSEAITAAIAPILEQNENLQESLVDAKILLDREDRGWALIGKFIDGEILEGLELDELKEISNKIRPQIVVDSLAKRGVDVHSGYTFSKGVNIAGVTDLPVPGKAKRGPAKAPSNLVKFVSDPVNQEALFASTAHEEIQKARFSDGMLLLACDPAEGTVRRIPLKDITGVRVNPEFPEEVWMYQRTWNPDKNGQPKTRWYYTNRFKGTKRRSVTEGSTTVLVDQTVTIIDRRFNRQVGYALGIPDAIAAMPWIAAYEEVMQYGQVVTSSLAKILFKVVSKTPNGAKTAGVKVSGMNGFGNTATMTDGHDLQAVQTAGRGYDFTSARPLAAMAAAALNISNIELLSDSSAAGSSYGAAQSLTPATKNAMRLMQAEWVEMFQDVLSFFGLGRPRVWFDPLEDVEPYKMAQTIKIVQDALQPEEYRQTVLDLLDIPGDPADIPEWLTADLEAKKQAASPGQGQADGTGGMSSTEKTPTKTNTEALRQQMAMEAILEQMQLALSRIEASASNSVN